MRKLLVSILLALTFVGCAAKTDTITFIIPRKVPVTVYGDKVPQPTIDFITNQCDEKCEKDHGVGVMSVKIYHNASEDSTRVKYQCLPKLEEDK